MHVELRTDAIKCVSDKDASSNSMEGRFGVGGLCRDRRQVKILLSLENCCGIFRLSETKQT